jgi:hypothetical protein
MFQGHTRAAGRSCDLMLPRPGVRCADSAVFAQTRGRRRWRSRRGQRTCRPPRARWQAWPTTSGTPPATRPLTTTGVLRAFSCEAGLSRLWTLDGGTLDGGTLDDFCSEVASSRSWLPLEGTVLPCTQNQECRAMLTRQRHTQTSGKRAPDAKHDGAGHRASAALLVHSCRLATIIIVLPGCEVPGPRRLAHTI